MTTAADLRVVMGTTTNQTQSLAISPTQPCDDPVLPRLKPELDLNDSTLFAVYCFIKNFIGWVVAVCAGVRACMWMQGRDEVKIVKPFEG